LHEPLEKLQPGPVRAIYNIEGFVPLGAPSAFRDAEELSQASYVVT